jgi:hypothetical protein
MPDTVATPVSDALRLRPRLGAARRAGLAFILCAASLASNWGGGARADSTPLRATTVGTADSTSAGATVPAHGSAVTDTSDMRATSEVPWNPPRAMARRQVWEQVVLLPGRLVTLPLSGLAFVARGAAQSGEDRGLIQITPRPHVARPTPLLALQLPHFGDRTGLGGAVQLTSPWSWPVLRARYAATLLDYNGTRLSASLGPLEAQYGYDWRPQDQFYGIGPSTSVDSLSNFAVQSEYARGIVRWSATPDSAHPRSRLSVSAWGGTRSSVLRTGRDRKEVSFESRFPGLAADMLDRRVEHLVFGGSAVTDWRGGRPHWGHGGRFALEVERYDANVGRLPLTTSLAEGASFTRVSLEGETAVSFMRDPRTIRLKVRVVDETVGSRRDRFLLSDLSQLGGREGLSGFGPGRFHDLDLLHVKLMYVFPLARLAECEAHSEWGSVYPDVWADAKLSSLQHSVGLSLRARNTASPYGEVGFDVSADGVRITYALGGLE